MVRGNGWLTLAFGTEFHPTSAFSRSVGILSSFVSHHPHELIIAYKSFVRPLLEYGSQVFSPYLQRDIDIIERVQRFYTRKVCKRAKIPYRDYHHRLEILKFGYATA